MWCCKVWNSRSRNQYIATFCVNLATISFGISVGWASPYIPLLESPESPLPSGTLTVIQTSNIVSILCVGGILGNFFHGYIGDRYGRKISQIIAGPVQIIGWILIYFAQGYYYLLLARFLSGFAAACIYTSTCIYVSEISEDNIRGFLGSWMVLFMNIGVLIGFILGVYISYNIVPLFVIPCCVIYTISVMLFPESPSFLISRNKQHEARKSLKFFRNNQIESFQEEEDFEIFKNAIRIEMQNSKLKFKDLKLKSSRKSLLYGAILIAAEQLCGGFSMLSYVSTIFSESGSQWSPNISSIVVAVTQIIANYISTVLVERAGRKTLIIISLFGSGLGLVLLAIYSKLKDLGSNVDGLSWIPVVLFSYVIFMQSIGVLNLVFLYLAELSALKVRGFIITICLAMSWGYAGLSMKYLAIFLSDLGIFGTMLIYTLFCFAGGLLIIILLPETKGKSIEEILTLLEK